MVILHLDIRITRLNSRIKKCRLFHIAPPPPPNILCPFEHQEMLLLEFAQPGTKYA